MNEYESGYLQALTDMASQVRQMVQDPSTTLEVRLELLGVLSFLSEQMRTKAVLMMGVATAEPPE